MSVVDGVVKWTGSNITQEASLLAHVCCAAVSRLRLASENAWEGLFINVGRHTLLMDGTTLGAGDPGLYVWRKEAKQGSFIAVSWKH